MKKAVVLVVDDDAGNRSAILEVLTLRFDCDFKEACDGEEAMQFIKSNPCDVMVLDIKMPKKGGVEVTKETKEFNPEIDIIVVTAYSGDEVGDELLKRSISDYIMKPINMDTLISKFGNILKKRGQKIAKI
jgi:two-component system response regulator YesN